jgi:excisionase family DNA binding protein
MPRPLPRPAPASRKRRLSFSAPKKVSPKLCTVGRYVRDAARMIQNRLAVSASEAAAMLSLSLRSIQNYIAAKKIPARKVGKRTLILVRDLEEFLRKDQSSPGTEQRAVRETA